MAGVVSHMLGRNPAAGGGSVSPSSATWRLDMTSEANVGVSEVEMRASIGGADECSGGTASAESTLGGNVAANAFDNNNGTNWVSSGTMPQWLQYAFGSSKAIIEISVRSRSDQFISDSPAIIALQYDAGGGSYTTLITFNTGPWGPGETRVFDTSYVEVPKRFWRLRAAQLQGGSGNRFSASEVEMRTTPGGSDVCTGGVAFSVTHFSGLPPANAFANDGTTTRWAANSAGNNSYIGYHFASAQDIVEVAITNTNAAFGPGESPLDLYIEYGVGNSWTTEWSVTGIPSWTAGETKVFTKP